MIVRNVIKAVQDITGLKMISAEEGKGANLEALVCFTFRLSPLSGGPKDLFESCTTVVSIPTTMSFEFYASAWSEEKKLAFLLDQVKKSTKDVLDRLVHKQIKYNLRTEMDQIITALRN